MKIEQLELDVSELELGDEWIYLDPSELKIPDTENIRKTIEIYKLKGQPVWIVVDRLFKSCFRYEDFYIFEMKELMINFNNITTEQEGISLMRKLKLNRLNMEMD